MLVPLTASLYVPGTLDEADKVLVDIGTGYFIEVIHINKNWIIIMNWFYLARSCVARVFSCVACFVENNG